MKKIVLVPQKVLTEKAQPVVNFDKSLEKILGEMEKALLSAKDPKGVGLAAPQIGYLLRIFCIKPDDESPVSFFINPEIISSSEEWQGAENKKIPLEGCLSIPNTWGNVKRKKWVRLSFQNKKGERKIKTFKDFKATIIQHEIDHLNGILFTRRVLEQGGRLYEIIKDKKGKEKLKELPL